MRREAKEHAEKTHEDDTSHEHDDGETYTGGIMRSFTGQRTREHDGRMRHRDTGSRRGSLA